jgi:hypothetical protein
MLCAFSKKPMNLRPAITSGHNARFGSRAAEREECSAGRSTPNSGPRRWPGWLPARAKSRLPRCKKGRRRLAPRRDATPKCPPSRNTLLPRSFISKDQVTNLDQDCRAQSNRTNHQKDKRHRSNALGLRKVRRRRSSPFGLEGNGCWPGWAIAIGI